MAVQISYNITEEIIEASAQGDFNWELMSYLASKVAELVKAKNCFLVMLDARELSLTLSKFMIYLTPEKLVGEFKKYNVDVHSLRRAIVIAHSDENFHFMETVSLNQSQIVHLFYDISSARAWLKK